MTAAVTPVTPRFTAGRFARLAVLASAGIASGIVLGALIVAVAATLLFDFHILTVSSNSMAPTIKKGDLIVVRPQAISAVETGDVVLFRSGEDHVPTVHRVVGINEFVLLVRDAARGETEIVTEHRLVTQGDRNPAPDPGEVTASSLMGTVWFTIPGAGIVGGVPLQHLSLAFALIALSLWGAWELQRRW
ncbi:MAG: hypothetical protein Kow0010_10640 [Dehalococcoidia bacterium]